MRDPIEGDPVDKALYWLEVGLTVVLAATIIAMCMVAIFHLWTVLGAPWPP